MKNGYAFIIFDSYKDADKAVDKMHRKYVDGYKITVEPAGKSRRRGEGSRSKRGP